jgi:ribose-phosphate pyrophosphokinase
MNVIGDVEGKTCIIYDDIVDTAGTLCQAAETIKNMGAKAVYACATHGVLSRDAVTKIENSCLEEMVFLNTIPLPAGYTGSKIRQLDAAPVFARAVKCIWHEAPISNLLF